MIEEEVKLLGININDLQEKLKRAGAKKIYEGLITSYYLSNGFRIRRFKDKCLMTYKQELGKEKNVLKREELEVVVSDCKVLLEMFQKVGVTITRKNVRKRISYLFNNTRIDIDIPKDYPVVVEIEGKKEAIKKTREILGI